ncbi:MAG TPA: hypothetical protein VFR38_10635 [Gaiellaceae bacterium]|nr:hypothetical protein [Gaiellaceae bacterium]
MAPGRRIRITIRGTLSERLTTAFEGMAPVRRGGRTELVGEIVDQAQLHGLLTRIRDLGLELEGVCLLPEETALPRDRKRRKQGRD